MSAINAQTRHFPRAGILIAMALTGFAPAVLADGTPYFSTTQIGQGRYEFAQKCSVCHGTQLQGGGAPALKGPAFIAQWHGKTLKEFYGYIHDSMPLGQGGALEGQVYADIVAYVLAQSGVPGGTDKFTPASPMDRRCTTTSVSFRPLPSRTPSIRSSCSTTSISQAGCRCPRPFSMSTVPVV